MKSSIFTLVMAAILLVGASPSLAREWTDNSDRFSVEAEFVEVKGDGVVLKKVNNETITVPLARLSKVDRRYLASLEETVPDVTEATQRKPASPPNMKGRPVFRKKGIPVCGTLHPKLTEIDNLIIRYMKTTGYKAGVLSISWRNNPLATRGYGWQDRELSIPINPHTRVRIASIDKPFTSAAIRALIRQRKLSEDVRVFPFLDISPFKGKLGDDRINAITVAHLLDHRGGWGHNAPFSVFDQIPTIERLIGRKPTNRDMISFMISHPLQFTPGEKSDYCSFGYGVLWEVVSKASGRPYLDYLLKDICRSAKIRNIQPTIKDPEARGDDEIWYNPESDLESRGYFNCFAISATSLCRFLETFWIDGNPRDRNNPYFFFFGSYEGVSSVVIQASDGTNIAIVFNQRGNEPEGGLDALAKSVHAVVKTGLALQPN